MREVKFRLFDFEKKLMIYPTLHHNQDYVLQLNCSYIGEFNGISYDTVKMILMQYVGLKDKNGKEIYEGDILLSIADDDGTRIIHTIRYNAPEARFIGVNQNYQSFTGGISQSWITEFQKEVIGNIHENPNLLQ